MIILRDTQRDNHTPQKVSQREKSSPLSHSLVSGPVFHNTQINRKISAFSPGKFRSLMLNYWIVQVQSGLTETVTREVNWLIGYYSCCIILLGVPHRTGNANPLPGGLIPHIFIWAKLSNVRCLESSFIERGYLCQIISSWYFSPEVVKYYLCM